jgi:hypothetical protein
MTEETRSKMGGVCVAYGQSEGQYPLRGSRFCRGEKKRPTCSLRRMNNGRPQSRPAGNRVKSSGLSATSS